MGVTITQKMTVKNEEQELTGTPVKVENHVTVKCDNPDCHKGKFHSEGKHAKVIEWDQENPETVPIDAYKLLTLVEFNEVRKVFCSKGCLSMFLMSYKPLKAPAEENVIEMPKRPENGQELL